MNFQTLLQRVRGPEWRPPKRLLALDPGETTGWCVFTGNELTGWGQQPCLDDPAKAITEVFANLRPTHVVCEDYKVYGWKTKQHSWAGLFTPKLIGGIQLLCSQNELWLRMQMANVAKVFCTDDKLRQWGMYQPSQRHARDAIRHACYTLLFNKQL